MSRSCRLAVPLLLVVAVTAASAAATAPAGLPHDEARQQDKRDLITPSDAHLLAAEGAARVAPLASVWAAEKKGSSPAQPSGGVGTLGDDQSSSGSGERGKEEGGGGSKEGEKQGGKSCLTKEECHKKRMLCGKGCTLSAHSKCAAKCTKSCVPTC
ncbi:hypothetical protein BS78_06G284000 [Paspalum vaginatum]|nr:hypothetical protein BS78_06G284000 [Paspalum vaginatum]